MQQRLSDKKRSRTDDMAACQALLADGSRTFYAASFLLPTRYRRPATALYAFCRIADDAVDTSEDASAGLDIMRERLSLIYAGRPADHPADRAFANTVSEFAIPEDIPAALLEGFAWDAAGRRYDTFRELQDYAARVAGTVGVMMAMVMGVRNPDTLARACDLGIAMQLTNIARDVGEDARLGRIYLPLNWLDGAGIDPNAFLRQPQFSSPLGDLIGRLLQAADEHYIRAEVGIARLPSACRPGIFGARLLYAEIGREVERAGCDSVNRRAVVRTQRKLSLLGTAMSRANAAPVSDQAEPLDAARFLVDAVVRHPVPRVFSLRPQMPWWDLHGRWARVIQIFEDLERRNKQTGEPMFGTCSVHCIRRRLVMRYWLGLAFVSAAIWLFYSAYDRRRRFPVSAASQQVTHPSLALLRDIIPGLMTFALIYLALKSAFAFYVLDGGRYLSLFDLVGFLVLLAAYATWLKFKVTYRAVTLVRPAEPSPKKIRSKAELRNFAVRKRDGALYPVLTKSSRTLRHRPARGSTHAVH